MRVQDEIGADLEVAVARSKKGDLERGKEEAMKARTARASLLSGQAVAKAAWGSGDAHVQSTATRQPRPRAFGGQRCSELDPSLRREAKHERTFGPGATVGVLGTGVPRLACLRPTAWLHQRPCTAHIHQQTPKTLARRTTQDLLWSSLAKQAHKERRYQGGEKPHEALMT